MQMFGPVCMECKWRGAWTTCAERAVDTKTRVIVHHNSALNIPVILSVVFEFCAEYVSGNLPGSCFLGCKIRDM